MITKYNEGCYRLKGRTIDKHDLEMLLEEAPKTKLLRARICVHYDENDPIQEMFVLMMRDSYKGTYKCQRASSKHLLLGEMDLEFLTDGGEILERVTLDSLKRFIKIEAGVYHRPIIKSDYILLHEVHQGPWSKDFFKVMYAG